MKMSLCILALLGFVSLGFARFTPYSAGFDSGLNGFSAGTWDNTDGASQPGCVYLVDPNYADDGSENSYHPQFWLGPNCSFPDEIAISYSMKLISGTPKTHINVMVRNRNNSPEWVGMFFLLYPLSTGWESISQSVMNFGQQSTPWESQSFQQQVDAMVASKGWKKEESFVMLVFSPGVLSGEMKIDDVSISQPSTSATTPVLSVAPRNSPLASSALFTINGRRVSRNSYDMRPNHTLIVPAVRGGVLQKTEALNKR